MKRVLSLILCLFLLLSVLTACAGQQPSDVSSNQTDTDGSFAVPQRLMLADGKELYTRLYSMFVSNADAQTVMQDAATLQMWMVGTKPSPSPIGGAEYDGTIYTSGDFTVKTDDELKAALKRAKSGDVIFIPSGVTIDLADLSVTEAFMVSLKKGVTLASDRGIGEGGVLRLSHPAGTMIMCGDDSVVTGLNICGVVTAFDGNAASRKDSGIRIMGDNVEISNCEFASFSGEAVLLSGKGSGTVGHCYIHHCETGITDNEGTLTLAQNAFFANQVNLQCGDADTSLPDGNGILNANDVKDLLVDLVSPDIAAAVFPANRFEVYTLLGKVASGETDKLIDALALHSGTTEYYRYKDRFSITEDGKVYGITDDSSPLGGGAGYDGIVTEGDFFVTTLKELQTALGQATAGQVIFIPSGVQIDLTGRPITVPAGVTLASDRGAVQSDGRISTGAMLFTSVRQKEAVLLSEGARFCGITLVGPDTERHMTHLQRGLNDAGNKYTDYYYKLPLTRGVSVTGKGAEVDNCEIAGFSEAGVYLGGYTDIRVHHSWIHHNQRNGFGYGIVLYGQTYVEVYRNLFNFDRHAIAADGSANSGYTAHDNAHLGTAIYHIFDAHGGADRGDGTQIACERIDMYNNVFLSDKIPYKKRGIPEEYSKFTRNIVLYPEIRYPYRDLYGENFICEDNIWGICTDLPDYDFEGGKTFTVNATGDTRLYENLASIDAKGYKLRYVYILVFAPTENGYYISEYGNNLDDGSIAGVNETVKIPEGGFVLVFTGKSGVAKQLYNAIESRHGAIYNTTIGLPGDYIVTRDGNNITVIQSK